MVNGNKVKAIVYRNGHTMKSTAEALGVLRTTFSAKVNTGSFSLADVLKFKQLFNLSNDEICDIFLDESRNE